MKTGRPRKLTKDRTALATLVTRWVREVSVPEAEAAHLKVVQVETPIRILVPRDCKAEIFHVPEGTEIRIRYSSKTKTHETTENDRTTVAELREDSAT